MKNKTSHVSLNGKWDLSYGPYPSTVNADAWKTIESEVPGNVEIDLMKSGELPELSYGDNINLLRKYEYYEWHYCRHFKTPEMQSGQKSELVFEGLDCIADILVNGQKAGHAENMLIENRFDISDLLKGKGKDNVLEVRIFPAVVKAHEYKPTLSEYSALGLWDSIPLRKAPHMFGWDIMPRIVSSGIWRNVYIQVLNPTRLEDVYLATKTVEIAGKKASLLADWHFATDKLDVEGMKMKILFFRNGKTEHEFEFPILHPHGRSTFNLQSVEFWWPKCYGSQNLYDVSFILVDSDGEELDVSCFQFGIRTAKLVRTDITSVDNPGEFVFVVNGEKIFVKGTNWVPLDALHSKDKKHLQSTFDMAIDLNCNMIRCWGGNVYEDHDFFDLCDSNGIMIWQDFALACNLYPQNEKFQSTILIEAESIIKKLRNHCSLVLWAGNNEIDDCHLHIGLNPNETDIISRKILRNAVRDFDPFRDYLPSSPYRSPAQFASGDENLLPEAHLWGPRDDFKGEFYKNTNAHFASEIGYHGCPQRKTLEQMMEPRFLWPWQDNEQWLTHAVRPHPQVRNCDYRIKLMADQIAVLFSRIPGDLDDFILASQISQAEAVKYFIEKFRMGKWRSTGILWWNLRDGWPIFSDAIVDYYNRKKLAYRYVKRVQTDVCVMCSEIENVSHQIIAVNDTLKAVSGRATVKDADTGKLFLNERFSIEANGKTCVGKVQASKKPSLYLIKWTVAGKKYRNHYLAGERPFDLEQYKNWLKLTEME